MWLWRWLVLPQNGICYFVKLRNMMMNNQTLGTLLRQTLLCVLYIYNISLCMHSFVSHIPYAYGDIWHAHIHVYQNAVGNVCMCTRGHHIPYEHILGSFQDYLSFRYAHSTAIHTPRLHGKKQMNCGMFANISPKSCDNHIMFLITWRYGG